MSDYDRYVQRYANTYGITTEEAEKHALVKSYKQYLEEEDKKDGKV